VSQCNVHVEYSASCTVTLTAISRHADIEMPVPSISFSAYSLPSLTKNKRTVTALLQTCNYNKM